MGIHTSIYNINEQVRNYWLEYYVNEEHCLCSLCGNSGVIDTTGRAVSAAGVCAGRKNFCICPNGQILRSGNQQKEQ